MIGYKSLPAPIPAEEPACLAGRQIPLFVFTFNPLTFLFFK
jgi:hypothetical protein